MFRPPSMVQLTVTAWLLVSSTAGLAASESGPGLDCQQLAARPTPDSSMGWLVRSLRAEHCYLFQARAVRISGEGVRTLALSHQVRDGFVYEVARYLDGPPIAYERRRRIVPGGWHGTRRAENDVLSRIEQHYRLTLGSEERVAGRPSMRLDIEPRDALRYGHRLWLDSETALPLKQVLVDTDGTILETFQLTELIEPTLHEQKVAFEPQYVKPAGPWRPGWLPAGYTLAPLLASRGPQAALGHRLYSDGLSSFSLFVEPLAEGGQGLVPGVHRLGVSSAVVRHLPLRERVMQVVVLGELPPKVLERVAARLEYQPGGETGEGPES